MSVDENILARFIEDRESLSEPEFDGLIAALKADPVLSATLKDLLVLDDLCGQSFSPDRRGFKAQIALRLRDMREGRRWDAGALVKEFNSRSMPAAVRPRASSWVWGTLAAAACAAVAATLLATGHLGRWERAESQVATIESSSSGLNARRGSREESLRQGAPILTGDTLVNPDDAETVLKLAGEDTRITLKEDSSLKFHQDAAGTRVELVGGSLSAQVAPHEPEKPLIFSTPQAEAKVLGTELKLSMDSGGTRLEVLHGRVQITRKADGETLIVESGKYATVAPGRELIAMALPPAPASADLDALPAGYTASPWRKLFDGATLKGWSQDKGAWAVKNGAIVAETRALNEQAALMTTEYFGDFEFCFAYFVDGNAYLEFRHRVTDQGCFQYQAKEKNHRAWRVARVRVIGNTGIAIIDGQRVPYEMDGNPTAPGGLRFYVQNRGIGISTYLKVKDIEVRTIQRVTQP